MSAIGSLASFPQKGFLGEAVFNSEGKNAVTVTNQVLEHLECEIPPLRIYWRAANSWD